MRNGWSATASSRFCSCCLYLASPSSAPNNIINLGIDHLVLSMCRVVSCVVGRGCLPWLVSSLGKTLLAFALLHFVFQGQMCLSLQVSLDFYFQNMGVLQHGSVYQHLSIYVSPTIYKNEYFKSYDNLTSNKMKSTNVFYVSPVILGPWLYSSNGGQ